MNALGVAQRRDIDPEVTEGSSIMAGELIDLVWGAADLDQLPEPAAIAFGGKTVGQGSAIRGVKRVKVGLWLARR